MDGMTYVSCGRVIDLIVPNSSNSAVRVVSVARCERLPMNIVSVMAFLSSGHSDDCASVTNRPPMLPPDLARKALRASAADEKRTTPHLAEWIDG